MSKKLNFPKIKKPLLQGAVDALCDMVENSKNSKDLTLYISCVDLTNEYMKHKALSSTNVPEKVALMHKHFLTAITINYEKKHSGNHRKPSFLNVILNVILGKVNHEPLERIRKRVK